MATALDFTIRTIQDAKASQDTFRLPCGWLDPLGVLHRDVQVREITGVEEDLLAARGGDGNGKFDALLANCTVRVGDVSDPAKIKEVVHNLPVGDRLFLLLAIRAVSLGAEYYFEATCPSAKCGKPSTLAVDLYSLEQFEAEAPTEAEHLLKLPSGKEVVWRFLTGRGEDTVGEIVKKFEEEQTAKGAKASVSSVNLSAAIYARIVKIDGKVPSMADVQALGVRDRNALRDTFQSQEGFVDTEIKATCKHCQHEYTVDVDLGQAGFFFPSVTSKRSRRKSST